MLCLPQCIQPEGCDFGLVSLLVILSVITWPRWCVSGFSTRRLLSFPLWLMRNVWEILWDYVNTQSTSNLHPLVLVSIGVSCLNQLLLRIICQMVIFLIVWFHIYSFSSTNEEPPHPTFICLFIDSLISVWIYGMLCIIQWIVIHYDYYLFSHPNCLRVEQWDFFLSFDIQILSPFWNEMFKLILYLTCLRISQLCQQFLNPFSESGI